VADPLTAGLRPAHPPRILPLESSKETAVRKAIKTGVVCLLALGLCGARALADEMTPEAQKKLILEGVALHDKGDYDAALAKYQEVLAANPKNAQALYETTFTLSVKKEWKRCYEMAEAALAGDTPYRALFYTNAGNCRDGAGASDKAIALYEKGLREFPDDSGLTYNLGIAYRGKGRADKAREMLERTVTLKPGYGSANLALAHNYEDAGLRIPALLAYLRYLSLDATSERARASAEAVRELLNQNVKAEGAGKVTITVPKMDEGEPSALSMMDFTLSLAAAANHVDENKGKPEIELIAGQLDTVFAVAGESKGREMKDCFACQHYLPFFLDLKKQGLLEPLTYVALSSLKLPGTAEWIKANGAKVEALEKWLASKR
jgi:tetratricopeptide (TPR) repeat protein